MHEQPIIIPTNHGLVKNLEGSFEPPRPTVATPLSISKCNPALQSLLSDCHRPAT